MKKASRFAALLAAVMLFGSVAAMPALAAENEPSAPVPTATAEPTVTPAPTDNGQSAPNNSGSAYIIAQTVTDAAGGEITTIDRDSRFNLILRVADYGAYNNFIPADQISARINSSAFTFTGNAEVGQLYEETDANGAGYYSYVLLFRDVIYNGGGNSVPINLSYLNSTMAMQQLSVTLGQCVDEDPDTPNLMIRASSYGNEAVVAGTPFTLTLTLYATGGQENPERCGHLADPAGRHHHDQRQPEQLPGHHGPQVHPRCQLQPDPQRRLYRRRGQHYREQCGYRRRHQQGRYRYVHHHLGSGISAGPL